MKMPRFKWDNEEQELLVLHIKEKVLNYKAVYEKKDITNATKAVVNDVVKTIETVLNIDSIQDRSELLYEIQRVFPDVFSEDIAFNAEYTPGRNVLAIQMLAMCSPEEIERLGGEDWPPEFVHLFFGGLRPLLNLEMEFDKNIPADRKHAAPEASLARVLEPFTDEYIMYFLPKNKKAASTEYFPKTIRAVSKYVSEQKKHRNSTEFALMDISLKRIIEEMDMRGKLFGLNSPSLCDIRLTTLATACGVFSSLDEVDEDSRIEAWRLFLGTLSGPSYNAPLAARLLTGMIERRAPCHFLHLEQFFEESRYLKEPDEHSWSLEWGKTSAAAKMNGCIHAGAAAIFAEADEKGRSNPYVKRMFLLSGGTPETPDFWLPVRAPKVSDSETEDFLASGELPSAREKSVLECIVWGMFFAEGSSMREDIPEYASLLSETLNGRFDISRAHRSPTSWVPHRLAAGIEMRVSPPLSTCGFGRAMDEFASESLFGRLFKTGFIADCLDAFSVSKVDFDIPLLERGHGFPDAAFISGDNLEWLSREVLRFALEEENPLILAKVGIPCVPGILSGTSDSGETALELLVGKKMGVSEDGLLPFRDAVAVAGLFLDGRIRKYIGKDVEARLLEGCLKSMEAAAEKGVAFPENPSRTSDEGYPGARGLGILRAAEAAEQCERQ